VFSPRSLLFSWFNVRLTRAAFLAAACVFIAPAQAAAPAAPAPSLRGAPALVVVLVVDQFRFDYLARYRAHLAPDGLALLLDQGANFTDARYRHSVTKTACGHAVILSGVHADVSGIIANDWLDRTTLQRVNCVDDPTVQPLGVVVAGGGVKLPGSRPAASFSPRQFLTSTVGDSYKLAHSGRPKVIAIAGKDRSAILLGGQLADAAYWMQKGRLVSSTFYLKEMPAWVTAFNDTGRVESFFGQSWDRLLPVAAYEAILGPDDVPWEYAGLGLGRTLPKRIDGSAPKLGSNYYEAFDYTPFKSEVMMDFARAAVENENLGRRGVTDFLCLGFSVNDSIGHNYGPDSHEVMDITLRTDRMLADFFKFLDARIGLKNCTIVFTADHGIPPIPEVVKKINPRFDAGRIDQALVLKVGEAALTGAFGPLAEGRRWFVSDATALLFFADSLKERGVTRPAAEQVLRDALHTIPFVQEAFTRTQLAAGQAPGELGAAMLLSFHPERSGDVLYVPKPYWFERATGTNHGTPYNYDVHVPLLMFGVGVKPGVRSEPVGIDDIAPTLAHLLGVLAPPRATGRNLF
jgi:hypothetical protein